MKISKPTKLKVCIVLYLMSMTLLSFGQNVETVLPNRIGSGTHSTLVNTESALLGLALRGYDTPDVFRYKNVTKVQYHDGVSWIDWATEDWKNLLDGNDNNGWSIPAPYGHFRITIDLGGTWVRPSAILVGQDWSGGDLNYTLTSESSNDQSNWSTELSLEPTGGSTAQNIFMLNSETGIDRYIRLTFNTGATSTNKFLLYQLSAFTKRLVGVSRAMYTSWDKNVGIGTASPSYAKLQVRGGATHELFAVNRPDSDVPALYFGNNGGYDAVVAANNSNLTFGRDFAGTYTEYMRVQNETGNVGIGTTNTFGYKLAVNGTIGAKEVNIEVSSAWPDYVFSKNYKLSSLSETESYIKEEGHLPNIPSASEVAENGIQLGAMNTKLLEKIEELTLHLIDQNKKMKTMQREFQTRIEALETK